MLVSLLLGTMVFADPAPHIIFHLVDDWGWYNVGFHGNLEIQTPNIDTLAKAGLILDRHYTHKFCSPTRSAFQTGRQPARVNVLNLSPAFHNPKDLDSGFAAVPRNMTGIAEKLKSAGYATHMVGKWDAGCAVPEQLPVGRGYDSSLGYMSHANDYWNNEIGNCSNFPLIDLWDTNGPSPQANGHNCSQENQTAACVYEDQLFGDRAVSIIEAHDPAQPLFLFYASHGIHEPLEVPAAYLAKFAHINNTQRQFYTAMVNFVDVQVGRIIAAVQAKGMWDNTLWACSADNGGPEGAANNFPLRGAKFSNFEGGIRVNAFVGGGFLPAVQRGKVETGLVAIWDWYATFCALAGVDPTDKKAAAAGLPGVSSQNIWPLISGANSSSPRNHMLIGSTSDPTSQGTSPDTSVYQGIILPPYKLIIGPLINYGWTSAVFPNNTGPPLPSGIFHCGDPDGSLYPQGPGCLFDIYADPTEHTDLAQISTYAPIVAQLRAVMKSNEADVFSPNRGAADNALLCQAAMRRGGVLGPFLPAA